LSLHPRFQATIEENCTKVTTNQNQLVLQNQFNTIMTHILDNIASVIAPQLTDVLTKQLNALKLLPPILPHNAMLGLPNEQYSVYNTIVNNLGSLQSKKYPFFFITGSAGTGKTYITKLIINWLKSQGRSFLLTAPTGVSAQTVGGFTLHSALRLSQSESGYHTLAFHDPDFKKYLQTIQTLIIEEVSMVSASLLDFLSNMFARIHNSDIAFGGINVILVGDLAQLPPVRGEYVFYSSVWHLFYPLFLHEPQRQYDDQQFYQMLEEIRFGKISDSSWTKITEKAANYDANPTSDWLLTTTHIIGDQINRTICNILPVDGDKYLLAEAIDFMEGKRLQPENSQTEFKSKTNMPPTIRLQQAARVMYLNNSLIEDGICNGTVGVVTDLDKNIPSVQVAFCIQGAIVHKWITRETSYFYINGQRASRTQFPLQNAFSLTVHKTQSLTLPTISLDLSQLFPPGQAYVAISRCPKWEHIRIMSLNRNAFMVDSRIVDEYSRLKK